LSVVRSFRLQLTIWYLALFSLLFVLFSLFLYNVLGRAIEGRLDEQLSSQAHTATGLFLAELEELNGDARQAAAETLEEMRPRDVLLAVFKERDLLAASASTPPGELQAVAVQAYAGQAADLLVAMPLVGVNGSRGVAHRFVAGKQTFLAVAVGSMDSIVADLQRLRRVLYISLPLLLAIAGLGGFALATRSLAPLGWMAAQARKITGSNLDSRLDVGRAAAELKALAASFNELLSRLDQSFETMRRFVADASHELRTPLSIIQGEADVVLAKDRSPAEYKESLAIIQDESRRLCRLVDDLLKLARADAGHLRLQVQELYLNDLIAECCRSIQPQAIAHGLELNWSCPGDVPFQGDEELLRRMVLNLLDNAIRYTPAGGTVSVALESRGEGTCIRVSDTGIGIAAEASPHVFERFFRADKARSRHQGGFGLGLSIVKWIAEMHHGVVELASQPGAGSTFVVLLPR
jgi:two-component system, OmpR family, sensor kinase